MGTACAEYALGKSQTLFPPHRKSRSNREDGIHGKGSTERPVPVTTPAPRHAHTRCRAAPLLLPLRRKPRRRKSASRTSPSRDARRQIKPPNASSAQTKLLKLTVDIGTEIRRFAPASRNTTSRKN